MKNENKVAIVTGGNSGIGYATAKLLKHRGYKVIICGRSEERVNIAAKDLNVECFVVDISSVESIRKLSQYFSNRKLDVLVNNAAIAKFMPISQNTEDDYSDFFNTNIRGAMMLIQNLLPSLEKAKGSVTNISSAVINNGLIDASLYAATKGAIDAFTRSLALELAPKNIRVNAVSPGAIDTPIIGKLGIPLEQSLRIKRDQEEVIPLKRFGTPDEVAHVIVAQLEATYVTGSVWGVDGGVDAH